MLQFTDKNNRKRSPHKQRAHPAVRTWQLALVVAFHKLASLSKTPTLPLGLIFGWYFFLWFCFFRRIVPRGVVGRSFRVVLFPLLSSVGWGGVAFSLFLCFGAAFLPILWEGLLFHLSSVGWCCFASSSFMVLSPFLAGVFSGNQHHPEEGEEGSTTRRRRPRSPTRKGGEGGEKAASLKGRRRDYYTTHLNFIALNRKLNFHFLFGVFLIFQNTFSCKFAFTFILFKMKGNDRPTQKRPRKAAPPEGKRGESTTTNFGWCCFPLSLWMVRRFSPSFGWGCLSPLFCHSSVGWCCLASAPLGRGAVLPARLGLVLFFGERAPPQRGRGRQHDQKEEEAKQPHPKGGRGRPRHWKGGVTTTQLNWTELHLTLLISTLCVASFILLQRERHHPAGKKRINSTTQRETGEKHCHPKEEKEGSITEKERGTYPSFASFGRWCLSPVAAIPSFWWCCFPSPPLGSASFLCLLWVVWLFPSSDWNERTFLWIPLPSGMTVVRFLFLPPGPRKINRQNKISNFW